MLSHFLRRKRIHQQSQESKLGYIEMIPVDEEIVSAQEFLNHYEAGDMDFVRNAEILMPQLGDTGYGAFRVRKNRTYSHG